MPEKVTMYEMFKYVFRTVLRSRTLLFLNIILLLVISGIEFIVPQITRHIIDVVIPSNDLSQLYVAVAVFVGAAIISLVISFTSSYLMSVISQKSITQLRKDLYSYLLELDTEFFESSKTGDLMVRLTSDISNLQNLISPSMLSMLGNFFTFIAVFIYIFILNWQLALAVSFTIPLMFIVYRFFKKRIRAAYKKVKAAESSMSNQIQNMLSQIQLIKSFTNEPIEYQYFSKVADDSQNYTITAQRNHALFTPLIGLIGSLGSAMVLLIGGYFIIQGELTIGEIVAYLSYVAMLQAPIRSLTNLLNQIQQSLISFGRIKEILGQESTIYDSEDAQRFPRLKEGISIRNVSFTYPNKEDEKTMALKNVSFEIPVNQKVALVGRSGSGKTTLTKLLTRMYDVNEGDILFDGVPIKDIKLETLRKHISVVSQDVDIIDGTIGENVRYGNLRASEEEVWFALKQADLDEFINSLPSKLDTEVGERGVRLSGGQKQRLSIARALLKDAPIIVLDEATAALDTTSERNIQNALDNLTTKKTSLVIAHRLSTVQKADNIIVLEEGLIKETGTHKKLLAQDGIYAGLYHAQFDE